MDLGTWRKRMAAASARRKHCSRTLPGGRGHSCKKQVFVRLSLAWAAYGVVRATNVAHEAPHPIRARHRRASWTTMAVVVNGTVVGRRPGDRPARDRRPISAVADSERPGCVELKSTQNDISVALQFCSKRRGPNLTLTRTCLAPCDRSRATELPRAAVAPREPLSAGPSRTDESLASLPATADVSR